MWKGVAFDPRTWRLLAPFPFFRGRSHATGECPCCIFLVYTPRVSVSRESCACTRVEFFEPAHVIPPRAHHRHLPRFFFPSPFRPRCETPLLISVLLVHQPVSIQTRDKREQNRKKRDGEGTEAKADDTTRYMDRVDSRIRRVTRVSRGRSIFRKERSCSGKLVSLSPRHSLTDTRTETCTT